MPQAIDDVLLRPGDVVDFEDRDDLLSKLDRLDQRVPARHEGRTTDHREHFVMMQYLRRLAGADLLPLPVELRKTGKGDDPPDFVLRWRNGAQESFELTEGSTREYQRRLSETSRSRPGLVLPLDINTPTKEAATEWAAILFSAFLRKSEALKRGRFKIDHLIVYDLTGLGILLPLQRGAEALRERIEEWYKKEHPEYPFGRVSIIRDQALLLDLMGTSRLLRAESPHHGLWVIKAHDEDDLQRRLREIDKYCRVNSIRHLKQFGSSLGDQRVDHEDGEGLFREDSDIDLLVEFEPGTRVTLLDMARMEQELGALIGFKVDLRTAEDLSRYFRHEVLQQAVELDAAPE